jgi:hypothetical protein
LPPAKVAVVSFVAFNVLNVGKRGKNFLSYLVYREILVPFMQKSGSIGHETFLISGRTGGDYE